MRDPRCYCARAGLGYSCAASAGELCQQVELGQHREPDIGDDVRAAISSARSPEYWRARSDYIARFWWRVLFFVLAVLVLGTIAEWLT